MTTLMRNGRDRRSGKPVKCHARKERALLVGTRSANHIRASGHSGCTQRPDTWLHPNASRKCRIPLASGAPVAAAIFVLNGLGGPLSVGVVASGECAELLPRPWSAALTLLPIP